MKESLKMPSDASLFHFLNYSFIVFKYKFRLMLFSRKTCTNKNFEVSENCRNYLAETIKKWPKVLN